jgi:hypothetical protein
VDFGHPAPGSKKLDWCEVETLDSSREARSRVDAGAPPGLAIDAADGAPTPSGVLLQPSASWGASSLRWMLVRGPPKDLKRATPEQLTGHRDDSWLCSWAVWIADADERRRIRRSSGFSNSRRARGWTACSPSSTPARLLACLEGSNLAARRGAGSSRGRRRAVKATFEAGRGGKAAGTVADSRRPRSSRSGERVLVERRRPGFDQSSRF